jgi:SagB-type dehydrogenase family enzyme
MAETTYISLPRPAARGRFSLEETIAKRRSQRTFFRKQLSPAEVGQLLWAAQGVTAKPGNFYFRSAPSAGALYPMEVYAVTEIGLYRYLPEKHALVLLLERDLRNDLCAASLGQEPVKEAGLDIVICASYERPYSRYGERGKSYVDMEAGHIAQNVHLQAVALGLGSVSIGAFDDVQVAKILALPEGQYPLCILPVGYIA